MSRRPLLQEGTITNSSVARPDRGGEALLRGAPAVLEPLEWETDSLEDGARLFLDADHTFAELPEALAGRSFIRSSFFGTRKVCRQPGIAFAITPARGQGSPSRADQLERMAFRQVRVPAIRVFSDGTAVDCSVYQKQMREGERIDIGSPGLVLTADAPWCVLVAARIRLPARPATMPDMDAAMVHHRTSAPEILSRLHWRRTIPSQPKFPIM